MMILMAVAAGAWFVFFARLILWALEDCANLNRIADNPSANPGGTDGSNDH